jgi:hypothetical protein
MPEQGLSEAAEVMSNISEIQIFAKMMAHIVADEVTKQLSSNYFKMFGTIFSALVSAIAYMYMKQSSERQQAQKDKKEATEKLFAVLKESTSLIETVKNGLDNSEKSEKKTRKAVNKMLLRMRGCPNRDKNYDDEELERLINEGEDDD